ERTAARDAQGDPVYSPPALTVVAEVAFPDGYVRSLESAELLVNGVSRERITPAPEATQVQLELDLSPFSTAGSSDLALEVKIVDSLGLESSALTSVVVDNAPPPPSSSTLALGAFGAFGFICVSVLILVGAGAAVYYFRRRPAQAAPASSRPLPAEPLHTVLAGRAMMDRVLANLTVLEGPKGLMGESINIVKPTTSLGRNPQTTDITFYAEEESSVSRLHCTIQKDGLTFKLTDNGSSAGTRLNGRLLPPNDPVVLADNDELVLGDLGRRGVKMRFNLASEPGEVMLGGAADDRTRIMDEPPPDDDRFAKYSD
ncbi:MAG: FHA domain-containing protein, partial [Chloroflexi bacterium]|nr:FHA domain-containing protein [Chloroflexota bacterium]